MNIDQLNSDCLLLLFDEFSLNDLISLRAVCQRWRDIIELKLSTSRELKVFSSQYDIVRQYRAIVERNLTRDRDFMLWSRYFLKNSTHEDQILLVRPKNGNLIPDNVNTSISTLFPRLSSLMIYNCPKLLQSGSFHSMLDSLHANLTSLSLNSLPENLPNTFWTTLHRSLPNLKRLFLGFMLNCILPQEMPILSQITDFCINHYRGDLVSILTQLGPHIERLDLLWVYLTVEQLETILKMNPKLPEHLKRLKLEFINSKELNREENYFKLFGFICEKFTALRSLDILLADQLSLSDLISSLSHLSNLTSLSLYLCENQVNQLKPILPPKGLPSVRNLYLDMFNLSVDQFYSIVPLIFPEVRQLTVKCLQFEEREFVHNFYNSRLKCRFVKLEQLVLLKNYQQF